MTEKIVFKTSLGERISYGLYFAGQLVFFALITSFLVPYFTDIGISALAVAAITLAVKVWDAVNDPLFGGILDKIRFKKGKFMPWIRISVIAIPLPTIFLFAAMPSLPVSAKIIWVTVGYILWDTAFTICDVPIYGLVTTLTDQQGERNSLMALTRVFSSFGFAVVIAGLPIFRRILGGWLPVSLALSVIGALAMIPVLFTAKERYLPPLTEKGITVKEMITFVVRNKYLLIFCIGSILINGGNISRGLGIFIARYNFGNESFMGLLGLISMFPGMAVSLILPFIIKKVDKFVLLFRSLIASIVVGLAVYFVGYHNLTAFIVMAVIQGLVLGFTIFCISMFAPDMVEYGRYITGIPASGISLSLQTFSSKLSMAIATSLGALCLSLIGFAEGEGAVQIEGFNDKLWFIYCIIPVIATAIALPLFSRYKLRDATVAIMVQANNGEMSKEEADKLLEGKI